MKYFAPAGTPVTYRDIAHGLAGSRQDAGEILSASLRHCSGLPNAWSISSGRAAMTVVLRTMRALAGDPTRDEVIIPAYTCYSVPAAVARAGLRPRLCDVDPSTLSLDPDALSRCDFSRALAAVSANLYGLPNDLVAIEAICRSRGIFMLDDAAQALGATLGGRAVGSFGDAGLYSFDKGKIISTIQGGAIVCRQAPLATELEAAIASLEPASFTATSAIFAKLLLYSTFLHPAWYGLVRQLPFSGLGQTRYELRYPVVKLSRFQTAVAGRLLARLAELNAGRRRRAGELAAALQDQPGIEGVHPVPGAQAAFARFPVRVTRAASRNRLLARLDRAGIGATASYPRSLADVPEVAVQLRPGAPACPGAGEVAATIVTLPTHAYCPPDLADRVRRVAAECLP